MPKALILLLLFGMVLFVAAPTNADLYQWVDEEGVVHFSDTPPADEQKVETIDTPEYEPYEPEPEPEEPQSAPQTDDTAQEPVVVVIEKEPARTTASEVELYTTSWCRYCKDAIAFLRKNNISFREFDVEKDPASAQRMRSLGGTGGVPFALINGKTVTGFSAPLYKRALGLR